MAKSRKKGKDKQPKTSLMTKLATELEVPSEILPEFSALSFRKPERQR